MSRPSSAPPSRAIALRSVTFERSHDVVVVGHGAAGGAAAIEAARAGADTLVLERMSRGGGTTALSTGLTYFGGGTAIQKACGFEDSPDNMQRYVRMAAGRNADPERVRLYCEGSVEHFEWFRALGVEYKASYYDDKVTHPVTDDCLLYTGNELAHPFVQHAEPAPRGHKPARPGEAGGYLMECVIRATLEAGSQILNDCHALRLVVDDAGRVRGLVARHEGREIAIEARRGVVLCAGGFAKNRAMVAQHLPDALDCNYPLGTDADDGRGILMGLGAGANAVNMNEALILNSWYPPSSHLKGVLVDEQGQRFINEDAYAGRTSDAIVHRAGGLAYLIVDDELYAPTQAMHRIAAVADTIEDLERELGMPAERLVETISHYDSCAARGEDPVFHKAAKWLRPLSAPPYAALDCRMQNAIFAFFTLGGLDVQASGEVLDADGAVVPGLYAAGRNCAGLCREGRTYASGLSIGDASFFGRLAGRAAAANPA
jgi:succinate dehydrogenase/fumarate reductase flavoprotein subunit